MGLYNVKFKMMNTRGIQVGGKIDFNFYSTSELDTKCAAFLRMLLEYGRAIGRSGSYVEIISIEKE